MNKMPITPYHYLEQFQFATSDEQIIEIINNIYQLGYDEGYNKGANDFM